MAISNINKNPLLQTNILANSAKEVVTGTIDAVKQVINDASTTYDGAGRMTGTDKNPIELLANMKIGGFCKFNDKMYEFMNRLMRINLNERSITLDKVTLGSYFAGDSDAINAHLVQNYSYTKDNNYLQDFVIPTKTDEMLGFDATRSFSKDQQTPYVETKNLYPDDISGAGSGDFSTFDKWAVKNKNSILYKTKQLFNQKKINTIISRFGTNADGFSFDLEYKGSRRTTNYGESHGRNLLRKDAEKGVGSYNINGYNNPFCRSWTHHYKYDRLNKTLRPLSGGDISIKQFHNWSATNSAFGDTKILQSKNTTVTAEARSTAMENQGIKSIDVQGTIAYEGLQKNEELLWKGGKNGWEYSVLDTSKGGDGLVRITPKFNAGTQANNIHTKDCMFSIENLAWKGYDPYSFENALSWEQRGPLGGRIMWFPPYGITFNESTNVNWSKNSFIGRGEDVYTYVNTQRTGNLSFLMVVDHPSIIDYTMWHGGGNATDSDVDRFFAGCDDGSGPDSLVDNVKPTPLTDEGLAIQFEGDDGLKRDSYPDQQPNGPGGSNDIDKTNIKVRVMAFFPNNYSGYYDNWAYTFAYLLLGWKAWKTEGKTVAIDDNDNLYTNANLENVLLKGDTTKIVNDAKVVSNYNENIEGTVNSRIHCGYETNHSLNGSLDADWNTKVAKPVSYAEDGYFKSQTDAYDKHNQNNGCIYAYEGQHAYTLYKKGGGQNNPKNILWGYRVDGKYLTDTDRNTNTYNQRILDNDGKRKQPNNNYKDLKTFKLNLTTDNWDSAFKQNNTEVGGGSSSSTGSSSASNSGSSSSSGDNVINTCNMDDYVNKDKRNEAFWNKYPNTDNTSWSEVENIVNGLQNGSLKVPACDSNTKYKFIDGGYRVAMDFNEITNFGTSATGDVAVRAIEVMPTIKDEANKIVIPTQSAGDKYCKDEACRQQLFKNIYNSETELGKILKAIKPDIDFDDTGYKYVTPNNTPYGQIGFYFNTKNTDWKEVKNATYEEALKIAFKTKYDGLGLTFYKNGSKCQSLVGCYVETDERDETTNKQYKKVVIQYSNSGNDSEIHEDIFHFYIEQNSIASIQFKAYNANAFSEYNIQETQAVAVRAGFANPVTFELHKLRYIIPSGVNLNAAPRRGEQLRDGDTQVSPTIPEGTINVQFDVDKNENIEEQKDKKEQDEKNAKKDEFICCSLNDFVCAMNAQLFNANSSSNNSEMTVGAVSKASFFWDRSENKETVKKLWKLFSENKLINIECTGFSNSHGNDTGDRSKSNNENLARTRAVKLSELIKAKFGDVAVTINIDSAHPVGKYDHNSLDAKQWRAAMATLTFEVGKKDDVANSHKGADENIANGSDAATGNNNALQISSPTMGVGNENQTPGQDPQGIGEQPENGSQNTRQKAINAPQKGGGCYNDDCDKCATGNQCTNGCVEVKWLNTKISVKDGMQYVYKPSATDYVKHRWPTHRWKIEKACPKRTSIGHCAYYKCEVTPTSQLTTSHFGNNKPQISDFVHFKTNYVDGTCRYLKYVFKQYIKTPSKGEAAYDAVEETKRYYKNKIKDGTWLNTVCNENIPDIELKGKKDTDSDYLSNMNRKIKAYYTSRMNQIYNGRTDKLAVTSNEYEIKGGFKVFQYTSGIKKQQNTAHHEVKKSNNVNPDEKKATPSGGGGAVFSGAATGDAPVLQANSAVPVANANNEAENQRLAELAAKKERELQQNANRLAAKKRELEAKQSQHATNLERLKAKEEADKKKKYEEEQDELHRLRLITAYHLLRSDRNGQGDKNVLRYDQEYYFFKSLEKKDKIVYDKLMDKIKYFDPAFHSMTPEGFNARLTFLNQCTRQGNTISASDKNNTQAGSVDKSVKTANNLAFGRPPYCVLRLGDFYNQMIVINSINIDYSVSDGIQWDMNMEGIGMQPLLARVDINFNFIGGSDMAGPVRRLQNAMTFNYYANARYYDNRADRMAYPANNNSLDMGAIDYKPNLDASYAYVTSMRK